MEVPIRGDGTYPHRARLERACPQADRPRDAAFGGVCHRALADGWTEEEIRANYPGLTHEDVLACLAWRAMLCARKRFIRAQPEMRFPADENFPGAAVAALETDEASLAVLSGTEDLLPQIKTARDLSRFKLPARAGQPFCLVRQP